MDEDVSYTIKVLNERETQKNNSYIATSFVYKEGENADKSSYSDTS